MLFLRRITNPHPSQPASPIVIGPREPVVIGPEKGKAIVVGPMLKAETVISPQPRAAWDELGWRRSWQAGRQIYDGTFQVAQFRTGRQRRFDGRVIVDGGNFLTYIADPPAEIKDHPKGPCFTADTPPWFHLHWHHSPRTVDDAILYMEKILSEALNANY